MDPSLLEGLLKAIRDAVSSNHRHDDVALPLFDPEKNDSGAEPWCESIAKLGTEFNWSSIQQAARAGKALRGSALTWFESWEPESERSWENFKKDITDLFPEKKNLSEKLTKAVLYSSDSATTYCEYAREKLRLLRNTKVAFSESQIIELVCGGIRELGIKTACLNNSVSSTPELITLLSTYVKQPRKRPFEQSTSFVNPKRPKSELEVKRCYGCGKEGHVKSQCTNVTIAHKPDNFVKNGNPASRLITCSFCKKLGHDAEKCFFKQRNQTATEKSINSVEKL